MLHALGLYQPAFELCEAVCVLPGGERRRLYATELTLGGAFIMAMRPPLVGTELTVALRASGRPTMSPIEARVIGVRLDPDDPGRTGFEIVFAQVDDDTLTQLSNLVGGAATSQPPRRRIGELRVAPRVTTDLLAQVEIEGEPELPMRVQNLSMSGALIRPRPGLVFNRDALVPGTRLRLTIVHPDAPESFTILAELVRIADPGEAAGFGIRFVDMSGADMLRLEGLLLESFVSPRRPLSWQAQRQKISVPVQVAVAKDSLPS